MSKMNITHKYDQQIIAMSLLVELINRIAQREGVRAGIRQYAADVVLHRYHRDKRFLAATRLGKRIIKTLKVIEGEVV